MIAGLLAVALQVAGLQPDRRLDQIVAHLGRGNAPWADIDAMARYRCAAVPRLVRELRIMPPGHYFPARQNLATDHYLWTIGALRTITGRDFYGSVKRRQLAR